MRYYFCFSICVNLCNLWTKMNKLNPHFQYHRSLNTRQENHCWRHAYFTIIKSKVKHKARNNQTIFIVAYSSSFFLSKQHYLFLTNIESIPYTNRSYFLHKQELFLTYINFISSLDDNNKSNKQISSYQVQYAIDGTFEDDWTLSRLMT